MKKIISTTQKPRVSIFRSNRFISGQAIDDTKRFTIASATTLKMVGKPIEKAKSAGEALGKALKNKKIEAIIFDRNGKKYHGSVAAFADGIRRSGVKF